MGDSGVRAHAVAGEGSCGERTSTQKELALNDPRIETWARTLVTYSSAVQPGDVVAITGEVAARPLYQALYRETLRAGGLPVVIPRFDEVPAELLQLASDDQLTWVSPVDRWIYGEADVYIRVEAEENTKVLSGIAPERQVARQRHWGQLVSRLLERTAAGEVRWVITLYPTDAYAQDAEMSTAEFAAFVFNACKLCAEDPADAWRQQAATQQRLINWLTGRKLVHLRGPGTDLKLAVEGRIWENCDGTQNFPDGKICTSPVEDATEGHVRFSYPIVTDGREIHDVRLRFESGRVVDAAASQGETYLIETLDADPGARRLGELAFGTNFDITRFSKSILFDEKIGGTVHMAIGAGFPDLGGTNDSAIHWDLICDLRDGGAVDVDGEPFLRDGRYLV
jgi:aminopeptidase